MDGLRSRQPGVRPDVSVGVSAIGPSVLRGSLRSVQGGIVQADVNGDKIADLEIKVVGVTSLMGSDFFL